MSPRKAIFHIRWVKPKKKENKILKKILKENQLVTRLNFLAFYVDFYEVSLQKDSKYKARIFNRKQTLKWFFCGPLHLMFV